MDRVQPLFFEHTSLILNLIFPDAASILALRFIMAIRSSRQAPISQFCYTVKNTTSP
jgi:hypothetical protein